MSNELSTMLVLAVITAFNVKLTVLSYFWCRSSKKYSEQNHKMNNQHIEKFNKMVHKMSDTLAETQYPTKK